MHPGHNGTSVQARSEVVVHAVAALGSFAFGSLEGNTAVMAAGAFPLLKQLLHSGNLKIVVGVARTMKILLEGNPLASQHIFRHSQDAGPIAAGPAGGRVQHCGDDTVQRLLYLISEGQEGTSDVAASLLARACQTRQQQLALSRARVWEITDGLLASSPKGQEAGLDLAASMVRGNSEQAALMLRRPSTNLVVLLGYVRHRRPFTRLLACTCVASAVACGALPLEKHQHEVSAVLHTAIKLLFAEPHKGIKEAAPNIVALLMGNNVALQLAASDAGLIPLLVSQVGSPKHVPQLCRNSARLEDAKRPGEGGGRIPCTPG